MAGSNNISKYFFLASFLCLPKHRSLLKLLTSRKVGKPIVAKSENSTFTILQKGETMKYNTGCTKNMQHRDFQLKSIPEVRFYF